jgi:hypothetical protein
MSAWDVLAIALCAAAAIALTAGAWAFAMIGR